MNSIVKSKFQLDNITFHNISHKVPEESECNVQWVAKMH